MNKNQLEQLLNKIDEAISEEEDDDIFDNLMRMRKDVNKWGKKGRKGELPHLTELTQQGFLGIESATSNHDESQTVVAEEAEADGIEANPLMPAYEDAMALMRNERYHSARNAFEQLHKLAPVGSEFADQVEQQLQEAGRKLEQQTKPLIDQAQSYAREHPNELEKQQQLWDSILEVSPDNQTAKQAISNLSLAGDIQQIREELSNIHQSLEIGLGERNLAMVNTQFGAIQVLGDKNRFPSLQPELDQALADITVKRDKLREELGGASTLTITGNQREAYRQARELLDDGVLLVVDAAGLFGTADAEIQTVELLKETQKRFIASLIDLAEQRLQVAETQKQESPEAALETLNNGLELLNDELLTAEDQKQLEVSRKSLEKEILPLEERLKKFKAAQKEVISANGRGVNFHAKLIHFQTAQELYPDYPQIERYIEETIDALAAQRAGLIKDAMISIRQAMGRDNYEGALQTIRETRGATIAEIPHPKPGSELEATLQQLDALQVEVGDASTGYETMMGLMEKIDSLHSSYGEKHDKRVLNEVQTLLASVAEEWSQHNEVTLRRATLTELQGDEENWRQGVDAYNARKWQDAEPSLRKAASSSRFKQKDEALRLAERAQAVI
ncbi:MAG: hypothetical protein ACI85U_001689, partial [Candidatus Promineifilaceae bacterium]